MLKVKAKSFENIQELIQYIFQLWEELPLEIIHAFIDKTTDKLKYIYDNKGEEYFDHKDRA